MQKKTQIMDDKQIMRTTTRIAHEIIESSKGVENVVLVGIRRRGEPLARMIADAIARVEGTQVNVGTLDITFYRDDLTLASSEPRLNRTDIPFDITDKTVVLVDDVIFTGRTARAAMEAVIALGRPAKIQLFALIDRGHAELPIKANYVGKHIPTARREIVSVKVAEIDGENSVTIWSREETDS